MAATVTCKTCGKVWEDRIKYMADDEKCGKSTCPNRDTSPAVKSRRLARVEKLLSKVQTPHCEVRTDKVKSGKINAQGPNLYVEVPKVIVMKISMK